MSLTAGSVIVKQLPDRVNMERRRSFLRELQGNADAERPCIVLDCSPIRHMDMATMLLLLDCLEDAMKRNGDIKLAAIPEAARASLELTGIDRLFEVFDTSADAVGSYHPLPLHAAWQSVAAASADLPIENAA